MGSVKRTRKRGSWESACTAAGRDPVTGHSLQEAARAIYKELRHIHGLTKTHAPLLDVASLLIALDCGQPESGPETDLKQVILSLLPGTILSRRQEIVQRAIEWTVVRPPGRLARYPGRPLVNRQQSMGIARETAAARMAAVLRLAKLITDSGQHPAGTIDFGESRSGLEVRVSTPLTAAQGKGGPQEVCQVWNRLMIKPITSVSAGAKGLTERHYITPGLSTTQAAQRILQRQLLQLLSRQYGLSDSEDTEYVHEARVATRRIRAALKTFRRATRPHTGLLREDVTRLARILGFTRDSDVFLAFIARYAQKADPADRPFLTRLRRSEERRRRSRYKALAEELRSNGHRAFNRRAAEWLTGNPLTCKKSERECISEHAPRALRKAMDRVLKHQAPLTRMTSEEQHDLRILFKRLRYTAEFMSELYPGRLRPLLQTAVRMQRLLGDIHDADVYGERVLRYCRRSRVITKEEETRTVQALLMHLAMRRSQRLRSADRTWREFCRPDAQKKLRRLIRTPRRERTPAARQAVPTRRER